MKSRRRLAAAIVSVVVLGSAAPALAQTRPNARAYVGPDCLSTVVPGMPAPLAEVLGGRTPGVHIFATGDEVFLDAPGGGLVVGQDYTVYRPDGEVRHPASGEVVGPAINLVATVRVLDLDGDRALARIVRACSEVEPRDRVRAALAAEISTEARTPALETYVLVTVSDNDGTVIHGDSESMANPGSDTPRRGMSVWDSYAIGDLVTVDRGRAHGWRVDQPVLVYRTRPEVTAQDAPDDPEPVVVGQGFVVWLLDSSAVVLLTEGDGTVGVGSRVRPAGQ